MLTDNLSPILFRTNSPIPLYPPTNPSPLSVGPPMKFITSVVHSSSRTPRSTSRLSKISFANISLAPIQTKTTPTPSSAHFEPSSPLDLTLNVVYDTLRSLERFGKLLRRGNITTTKKTSFRLGVSSMKVGTSGFMTTSWRIDGSGEDSI